MKLYFLLRNNIESGPYTQKDLKEIGLAPSDLLWIEGDSTAWQHPTEINGLKSIARGGILKPLNTPPPTPISESSYDTFSSNNAFSPTSRQTTGNYAADAPTEIYPLNDKEGFSWNSRQPRINATAVANSVFGLGVLLVGVMLFAFVIKKLVDHFEYEPQYASSEAVEISSEKLPVNTTSHAAMGTLPSEPTMEEPQQTTEAPTPALLSVAADVPQREKTQQTEQDKLSTENKAETTLNESETMLQAEVKEEKKVEENETKPVAKPAPALSVSANDYKVGMFGGISDLEITVNNPSSLNIEKAVVEVEFLKPNGSVVKSEKVAVPASSRGVKVRYRVVSSDVHDGKVASNDI